MYAIMETGGKQQKVAPGDKIKVEKVCGKVGDEVKFDKVLMIAKATDEFSAGSPYLEGAQVTAKILEQGKAKKVTVFKYKPKKRIRIKTGHRQPFTLIEIKDIIG